MAQINGGFNALQHNPEKNTPRLPVGAGQPIIAIDSALKGAQNNSNSGYLELTCRVLDGPNKGAIGALIFNIYNQSEKAAEIARNDLAAYSQCCGVPQWTDSQQLHNMPLIVDVAPQKVKEGDEDKGYVEVTAYYNPRGEKPLRGGGFAPAPGGSQQQQNPQQQQNVQQPDNSQQNNQGGQGNQGGGWNNQNNQGGGNTTQVDNIPLNQNNNQQQPQNNNQNAGWNNNGNNGNNNGGNTGGGGAPWNR